MSRILHFRALPKSLKNDDRGLAAIEFAFIAGLLSFVTLNVADFAFYFFDQMQVDNAAQVGAQAAWSTCDLNHVPATTNCSGLSSAVSAAVQSTSLGTSVALQTGSPAEGYYCVSSSGTLQSVGSVTNPAPANCTAAGESGYTPGDWIEVQTTYTWTPIFPGLTVASALPRTMTSTAWMRLQ
jgi:Flp pilus assembly protein TadG